VVEGSILAALLGILVVGWIAIPAAIRTYSNSPMLSRVFRNVRNMPWAIPVHIGFGMFIALVLSLLGFRLPAI
jgi:ABC-type spermidine/putrescine transport system permease subunit II